MNILNIQIKIKPNEEHGSNVLL